MEIDRRAFIASLGGAAVVDAMSSGSQGRSARAPPERSARRVAGRRAARARRSRSCRRRRRPRSAAARDRCSRRRVRPNDRKMPELAPMPDKPTLVDFFNLRWAPANHVLQSATRALKTGMSEQVILACLLHDVVQNLIKVDHGWWGAQMIRAVRRREGRAGRSSITRRCASIPIRPPATSIPSSTSASTARTTCRRSTSRTPTSTRRSTSGTWKRGWSRSTISTPSMPDAKVSLDPFIDIIGRHFKQPKEGLGFDNSPTAHMWRTMMFPDNPL